MEEKDVEKLLGKFGNAKACESGESKDSVDAWKEEVANLNETISRKKKKLKKLKKKKRHCLEIETEKRHKLKKKIRDLKSDLKDAKKQLRRVMKCLMEKEFENTLLNIEIKNQKQILELQSQIRLLQQKGMFREEITQILLKEAVPGLVTKYGKKEDFIDADYRELE